MDKDKDKKIKRAYFWINTFYSVSVGFIIWSGITLKWMRFLVGIILIVITALMQYQIIKLEKGGKK